MHVPNAQPPLPSDWEVRPTYPIHTVPYYLAPLWEAGVRQRAEAVAAAKAKKLARALNGGDHDEQRGRIPAELKQKMKKAKGAKSLLQDLEEEVRKFIKEWETQLRDECQRDEEIDSEDEEIVFVGRNGRMSDEQRDVVEEVLAREKLVFDSLADDHGASFGYVSSSLWIKIGWRLTLDADAGSSTPLLRTMVSVPDLSLSVIRRDEKLMLVSRR